MKKFSWFLMILVFFSLSSCNKLNSFRFKNKLIIKKNVSIAINFDTNHKSNLIQIKVKNDTTYLIRKNVNTNSILVYNWTTGKKTKSYTFQTRGVNSVEKFDSSAFIEIEEGLILIGTAKSQIYLIKNDSVIYKELLDKKGDRFGVMINGFNKNLPILFKDDVYLFRKPPVARIDKTYYDYNLLIKFNLKTKDYEEINVKYSELYKKGECWGWQHLRQSFTVNNKNEIIFSFPIDSSLYKYDINNSSYEKITTNVQSRFKTTYIPMPCGNLTDEQYQYYIKVSTRYESIKYDKFKDIYYRIILLRPDDLSKENAYQLDYKISIMVLDANFRIISEDLLPLNKYDFDDFFVTKEGLWMSVNNPNNPKFNDEIMSFDLLTLKEEI